MALVRRGPAPALLAVTVVAGFASTVFLPASDAFIRAFGYDAGC